MTKHQDIELITLETCVQIVKRILAYYDTSMTPLMKTTLGCIWEKSAYQAYIDTNQLNFKVGSMKTKANMIYRLVGEYFHITDLRKPNFKDTIQQLFLSDRLKEFSDLIAKPRGISIQASARDSQFIGRDEGLSKLYDSLKSYKCVNIWGEAGVGKTSLVREYEERNQPTVGKFLWTTATSSLTDWVSNTLAIMEISASETAREKLFKELFQKNWIIVIDDAFQINDTITEFVKPLCMADCKSTFILISRSKQNLVESFSKGCCLHLSGLTEYVTLFENLGLSSQERWQELAEKYNYNPGELINIARIIISFFEGNIDSYLDNCSTVFSQDSLTAASKFQFSKTELRILTLIDEKRQVEPKDIFKTLQASSLSSNDIFDCMATLENRAIIEKTHDGFVISPVVRKRLKLEGQFG